MCWFFKKVPTRQDAPESEKFNAILAKIQPPVVTAILVLVLVLVLVLEHPTSNNQHSTSNIQHPTSPSPLSPTGDLSRLGNGERNSAKPKAREGRVSGERTSHWVGERWRLFYEIQIPSPWPSPRFAGRGKVTGLFRAGGSTPPPIPATIAKMKPAVFLDRDGVLIEERNYLHRVEDVVILPGVMAALKRLADAGFSLFIVSNQSGVGRGYFTLADVERVNEHLRRELARAGARFDKIYIAPEAPDQPSRGRKPSPQFLFDARDEFKLNLAASFMVGDKLIDLECGWNAGVKKSILVRTGYGADTEKVETEKLARAVVVDDLSAAASWILKQTG
jgi:D-glycero-D-manno-heptose 1,7-bisphosphate phosphatase